MAGDHDVDLPDRLTQPVGRRLVGTQLIVLARVEERDQDVGEHVAGEQNATVGEEDRGVADGVRLMLDDLARQRYAVRGQRGDERDQLERDARGALRRHRLPPLPGFAGTAGAGGGGVAGHVGEPGMPGSTTINPSSPRTTMELVQTHELCRTQTPSATPVSIDSSSRGSLHRSAWPSRLQS